MSKFDGFGKTHIAPSIPQIAVIDGLRTAPKGKMSIGNCLFLRCRSAIVCFNRNAGYNKLKNSDAHPHSVVLGYIITKRSDMQTL
jgi:hypothetical protein